MGRGRSSPVEITREQNRNRRDRPKQERGMKRNLTPTKNGCNAGNETGTDWRVLLCMHIGSGTPVQLTEKPKGSKGCAATCCAVHKKSGSSMLKCLFRKGARTASV